MNTEQLAKSQQPDSLFVVRLCQQLSCRCHKDQQVYLGYYQCLLTNTGQSRVLHYHRLADEYQAEEVWKGRGVLTVLLAGNHVCEEEAERKRQMREIIKLLGSTPREKLRKRFSSNPQPKSLKSVAKEANKADKTVSAFTLEDF